MRSLLAPVLAPSRPSFLIHFLLLLLLPLLTPALCHASDFVSGDAYPRDWPGLKCDGCVISVEAYLRVFEDKNHASRTVHVGSRLKDMGYDSKKYSHTEMHHLDAIEGTCGSKYLKVFAIKGNNSGFFRMSHEDMDYEHMEIMGSLASVCRKAIVQNDDDLIEAHREHMDELHKLAPTFCREKRYCTKGQAINFGAQDITDVPDPVKPLPKKEPRRSKPKK